MIKIIKKSAWATDPDYNIHLEILDHRIQIKFDKITIADSDKVLFLHEQNYAPICYFPPENVRMDLLKRTKKITFCAFKGEATHWALTVGRKRIGIAAWSYQTPFIEVKQIQNYIAFYPSAIEELIQT